MYAVLGFKNDVPCFVRSEARQGNEDQLVHKATRQCSMVYNGTVIMNSKGHHDIKSQSRCPEQCGDDYVLLDNKKIYLVKSLNCQYYFQIRCIHRCVMVSKYSQIYLLSVIYALLFIYFYSLVNVVNVDLHVCIDMALVWWLTQPSALSARAFIAWIKRFPYIVYFFHRNIFIYMSWLYLWLVYFIKHIVRTEWHMSYCVIWDEFNLSINMSK